MSFVARPGNSPKWADDLPEGWIADWVKWSVSFASTKPTDEDTEKLPYISNEDIASWTGKMLKEAPEPADKEGRVFQRDDVLFNKLRPYLAKVYHADFDGISSGELLNLRSSDRVLPRFLFHVLSSSAFIDAINAETFGTKMPRADWETVGHQPLPLPDLETQRRIAGYLDDKTARIDALIEKKRALLDRLAEKRQALITRAVTRGLNPSAPLKDSGIDWLGKVPAHWEVKPLRRFVSRIEQGWSPSADDRARLPEEWAVLKSGCVNGGTFDPNQYKVLPEDTEPLEELEVKDGDILMCRASGSLHYIGSVAIAHEPPARLIFSDKNYRITPDASVMDRAFFVYGMASKALREQIVLSVSGAEGLANNIAQASVKEYLFAVPPLSEQKKIGEFLTVAVGKIENVAARCEMSIEKLTEYRAALVTAAVTGKIKALLNHDRYQQQAEVADTA